MNDVDLQPKQLAGTRETTRPTKKRGATPLEITPGQRLSDLALSRQLKTSGREYGRPRNRVQLSAIL